MRNLIERGSTVAIEFHIAAEILGPGRQAVGEQVNELLAGFRLSA